MSVGCPTVSSTNCCGLQRPQLRARCRPASRRRRPPSRRSADHRVALGVHRRSVERVVAAADAQEARALLERLRAQPRHVARARSARGTGRARRGAPRSASARPSAMPETRRSSGAEAVLTSTPTAFTQSSTTASSERDSALGHVVLVLADADRLRVDLHQLGERILQAPRDRHRAAQRDVEVRAARRAYADAEYTDAPASLTITLVSFSAGVALRPARRPARPSRATRCRCRSRPGRRRARAASRGQRGQRARPSRGAARAGRSCRWRRTLPVASTTATLKPVRKPGSRPIVARVPAGAASSRSRRFAAKTPIASSSADLAQPHAQVDAAGASRSACATPSAPTSASHLSAGAALVGDAEPRRRCVRS